MNEGVHRAVIDLIEDGVYVVDADNRVQLWNRAAEQITGYTAQDVLGHSCHEDLLLHLTAEGDRLCAQSCPASAILADGRSRDSELYLHHKDGHSIPVRMWGSAIRDDEGRVTGAVEFFRPLPVALPTGPAPETPADRGDIDPLTGLGNRRYLERRMVPALVHAQVGVLFIDVDHFKEVNDTHGHSVGDRVLRMVGQTLAHGLRRSDWALRWGGEEFLAVVHARNIGELEEAAQRLRSLVAGAWVDIRSGQVAVTVSIGATMLRPGESVADAIDRADRLMYVSKQAGRNRVTSDRRDVLVDLTGRNV